MKPPNLWIDAERADEPPQMVMPILDNKPSTPAFLGRGLLLFYAAITLLAVFGFARRDGPLTLRWAIELSVFLGGMTSLILLLTRPLWRPPARWGAFAVSAALWLPLALAIWPEATHLDPAGSALGCLLFGVEIAAPAMALLFWLHHGRSLVHLVSASAFLGTLGVLGLHLHCAGDQTPHLLQGHATVPIVWMAGSALLIMFRGAWPAPRR